MSAANSLPPAAEAGHTPTPWSVQGAEIRATGREFPTIICDPFSGQWENADGTRRRLLPIDEREANAAFIVKACNEYASTLAKLAALEKALEQASNTVRSLIHTLETIDSDERFNAREEKRSAHVHTNEIKQAKETHAQAEAALLASEGTP